MNGGVGDAVNLGWKLAAVLQGWGGARLLDSYEFERRQFHQRAYEESASNYDANDLVTRGLEDPIVGESRREALADRIRKTKPVNFKSLGVTLGYRYEESPVIALDGTPATPYETSTYVPTGRPGHRAPHYWLRDGTALFDQFFGKGFTLLVFNHLDVSVVEQAASRRGVPLTVFRYADPELWNLYQAKFVLVRSDQHVAWRSDTLPTNPGGLFDLLRGADLTATP
jgi:hypothetical protein